jgi:CheY-like chemotaxis protein
LSNPTVVLYIDDDLSILALRQLIFRRAGYKVLVAKNGESALQIFTHNDVDLVITDQLLPDRTGGQIASEMKRLKPEVPIILYTGLMEPPPDAGQADLILTKGLTPPEFLAAVAKLVTKSRSGAESA